MLYHCRRRLSNTFHIFKIEVGSSLRSFVSLTMKMFCLFYPASTQDLLISKIWTIICGGNGVMMDPYAYPLQEKAIKHLSYMHKIEVRSSLKWSAASTMVKWCLSYQVLTQDLLACQDLGHVCDGNEVMMDPHAYPLLKKVINNFKNELDRSGVQSEKVV
jgi:hypothetical protein